jgi:hypothetical protein
MKVPPRRWPEAALTLARTFGIRGIRLRAAYEARRRLGRFRATPRHAPSPSAPGAPHPFIVDASALAATTDRVAALARAARVASGEYEAYRCDWRPFPADAAGWHRHPGTRRVFPDVPWWRIDHLDAATGDIKDIWEPARFGWAYDLVRAYLLTGDSRWAEAFHGRFAQWRASSPPFRGVHWSCGQEAAIRAAALLYAEANLPADAAQAAALHDTLAATGERIADAFAYAVSQRNNHAISEAVGMLLMGKRLEGSHPEAEGWRRAGERWTDRLVREQFAPDGWYTQHSFTYLRLALDQCLLATRGRGGGGSLSPEARERLRAAARLLLAVMEPGTGIVPNHGANDGAFAHPVTLAPYRDFRPVVTAVCAALGEPLPSDVAADPETLAWLGLAHPAAGPPLGDGVRTGASGWASVRAGGTQVFLRAGRYHSRPSHLDALHVDVRHAGREVVVDPGTYAYNGPPPWRNPLTAARLHNGPVVDGTEPGVRGPRFLWYLWPRARLVEASPAGAGHRLRAVLEGRVERTVLVEEGRVEVTDRALGTGATLEVRWTLHPDAHPGSVAAADARHETAVEGAVEGWFSPRYGERIPSQTVFVRRVPPAAPEIRTLIRAAASSPEPAPDPDDGGAHAAASPASRAVER